MTFRKFFSIITIPFLITVSSLSLSGQDYQQKIAQNKNRAANVYHYYEYTGEQMTPAPKGFEAFYISHYGRHGSRYHTTMSYFNYVESRLSKADSLDLLSSTGKALLSDIRILIDEHQGMLGMLTTRGAEEHRGIASRMYQRNPEVFNGKSNRSEVNSAASYLPRCIVSMTNFNTALIQKAPHLKTSYITGPKIKDYIAMEHDLSPAARAYNKIDAELRPEIVNPDRIISSLFTDKARAVKELDIDEQEFVRNLFEGGSISECTDQRPDIFRYFNQQELEALYILRSNRLYNAFGNDIEFSLNSSAIARPLLRDFIDKADAALSKDSPVAADLRFGHDTGILPLVCFIGIKPMDIKYHAVEAHNYWNSFELIPMASNFQMIFYKNKKGEVLVKMLYNEKETTIPAVPSYSGPYCRWQDLRTYFVNLLDSEGNKTITRDLSTTEKNGVTD